MDISAPEEGDIDGTPRHIGKRWEVYQGGRMGVEQPANRCAGGDTKRSLVFSARVLVPT
jgi:hypothetical protein